MKKINILPFREFWQDCFNCIVYSMTKYAFDVPKLYYYNNMYTYKITEEAVVENGKRISYMSATPWTDNFRLIDEITTNRELQWWEDEKDIIGYIKKNLDNDRIVLAGIDLYYWIQEGLHYHHNHIDHYSLIIGYDDEKEEMIVLETGDDMFAEFRVGYDDVKEAVSHCDMPTRTSDINWDAKVTMFSKEDLVYYAGDIINSIQELEERKHDFWNVNEISNDGLYEVLSILQTHIFSMQNRASIDSYMFKNAFKSDVIDGISLSETLTGIAREFEKLKGSCIKHLYRENRKPGIQALKDRTFELLEKNKNIWQLFVEKNYQIEMKESFD